MFFNSYSLALSLISLISLLLIMVACRTAFRVLRYWEPASDSNTQIQLEGEIWLSSALVKYGLALQIVSLLVFILSADHFCQVIAGAMCATGSLTANDYGIPALVVKLAGVFVYGFWLVVHQLDIRSEEYPLVRFKFIYLLCLFPLLLADSGLQTMYLAGLKPDIITSCCGVIFENGGGTTSNLLAGVDQGNTLLVFYLIVLLLFFLGGMGLWLRNNIFSALYGLGIVFFFGLALLTITTVMSSYIYAMPFHKCPFCIIKPEYNHIGLFIYASLIIATFSGLTQLLLPLARRPAVSRSVASFRRFFLVVSLVFLLVFGVLASYHYLLYMLKGGEY